MISRGLLAEFPTPEALTGSILELRELGLVDLDVFTPYPLRDLEPLLGIKRSPIPRWMLAGGLTGALGAYLLQWWVAAISYPLDVGGRPLHSAPAFIPITFESGILAASLTGFVAVLLYARLFRLYDPVFEAPGFERASVDRFWIAGFASEALYEKLTSKEASVREVLTRKGALQVVLFARPT
jgi:hypothetical protein